VKILIVEDEENSRVLLQDILDSEGYTVISTKNGKEALDYMKKEKPDIIITDILMPEIDGFELCKHIKKNADLKSIPVVFYTATYTAKQDKEYALSLGASRFIVKPMEPDLFIREIRKIINEAEHNNLQVPTEFGESEEKLNEDYSDVLKNKLEHKIHMLQNEINEHKQAREELLKSQKQLGKASMEIEQTKLFLDNILESMPSILIVLDRKNTIIQWNQSASIYLGVDYHTAINQNFFTLLPGLSALKEEIARVKDSYSPRKLHYFSFQCINDKFFNISLFPLQMTIGEEFYICIRFDDITEFKQVEEQLSQSRKMEIIGQLTGGIAHDFNNQLSGLLAYAEIIKYNYNRDDELMSYLDKILLGIQRSSDLIQKLLAFSRKGKYISKPFDIHSVIEEVISILIHSIDKNIHINVNSMADSSTIEGDATQIQNAILNLAINARDAMPRGGDLLFSTRNITIAEKQSELDIWLKDGEYLILTVQDTGIGMDEKTLTHIFEPFFTTKDPQSGSGMGLAAVHGTIQNHKGIIKVESIPGQGTSFIIYLPVSHKNLSRCMEKDTPVKGNARILLVEDELSIRESLQEILEKLGYSVLPCQNGQSGLEVFTNRWEEIDVIIMDIIMPGLNGFEVFKQMKQICPYLKVIFMSGYNTSPEIQGLLNQDNVCFMRKPLNMVLLTKKIAELSGKTESSLK
jgi:two-component system, cell cycle sensor histidine kinase and response regulator CckA